MEKALKILKEILDTQDLSYKVVNNVCDVIKELEEAMKTKTCDGCKFRNNVKFVQVVDETLECCYVCVRQCYDYFEPKDNA